MKITKQTILFSILILQLAMATIINVPGDYSTIQAGIDVASNGDTVLVQPDTYIENINYNGKNIVVGSLYLTTQDTSYISSTMIDGNQNGRVVTFISGEDTTAALTGFTITNGLAYHGGGIYCDYNCNPILTNVTITDNSASYDGGGIYCRNSSPSLENVTISGDLARQGGGIYCRNSSPSLVNVTISGNSASSGGGIYCDYNCNPILTNVTITDNSTYYGGGGIYCYNNSSPSLVNTIVSDNTGNYGIYVDSGNSSITYSDFYNNENGNFYGCGVGVGVNVTTNANGDSCDLYYNIQEDPLFVDPANGDYHLSWTNYPVQDSTMSPCIDAGDPNSPVDPDITITDMGAFYFDQSLSISDENISMLPEVFNLHQNYPNPFNPVTTIRYELPQQSYVTIVIYDLLGREVKELVSGELVSGYHKAVWDGTNNVGQSVGAGIYLYRIQLNDFDQVRKMILLK